MAKKKIVVVFLLAILLPLLAVGYLSFNTLSERRKAVKGLLESNLWISGEAALRSIEEALLMYESEALKPENFSLLIQSREPEKNISGYFEVAQKIRGQPFLLDDNFKVISPQTGMDEVSIFRWEANLTDVSFKQTFAQAESLEFSRNNYSRAADLYRKSADLAPSKQQKAFALEGLARCRFSDHKYVEAFEVYSELLNSYAQFLTKAGHPYGLAASFRLSEIQKRQNRDEESLDIILRLYDEIRKGAWLLNLASYDFFITEMESILDERCRDDKYPALQTPYLALKQQRAPYLKVLMFADFLKRDVIHKVEERMTISRQGNAERHERFIAGTGQDFCLVSWVAWPNFLEKRTCYAGFCWDIEVLKNEILPQILQNVSGGSTSQLLIFDENNQSIIAGNKDLKAEESIILPYRQFPFPWKILVSQPALDEIERAARQENIFYGVLFAVIIFLMILGAFLIARDLSRESETTRIKTEFVHNVSHELKTPLTLIRLYGETLQRKKDLSTKGKREAYQIITKECERLSHMINNVLDFSRIEMGRKEFNFSKGHLGEVIQDTLDSYRYHLEKKGFSVQSEITTDLPEMKFDKEAMASVLINLLSNAMKFSLERKDVTVKLFCDKENAVLRVTDRGMGISPKDIASIFKRFYRSQQKVVSESRGSGLGLTLIKHIAEAHGGSVKVESEPGKGSVFSVIIPIADSHTNADRNSVEG